MNQDIRKAAARELLERIQARDSVAGLYGRMYPQYKLSAFHHIMAKHLDDFVRGAVKLCIINIPPGHVKSMFASQIAPASYIGNFPDGQVISGSYNTDLAKRFGREVRNLVASQDYHNVFEDVWLRKDSKSAGRWNTNKGGSYISAAVEKSVTGNRANRLIIDDPHADFIAGNDPRATERAWEWFKSLYTRLMPGSGIALIMQRMSNHDMTSRLVDLAKEKGQALVHINFPAIKHRDTGKPIKFDGTEDGLKELRAGIALWPEFFTMDVLIDFARTLGASKFNAMYQQIPDSLSGNIIKEAWIRHWGDRQEGTIAEGRLQLPSVFDIIIQSWDMRFKKEESGSYVIGQVWGFKGPDAFLLDQLRGQWGFDDSLKSVISLSSRWPRARKKLVENKANGPAIEDKLKRKISGISLEDPLGGDKSARLRATEPDWSTGHVHLPPPESHPWVKGWIQRILEFPKEPNDEGDAASQALNWRAMKRSILETLREGYDGD